MIIIFSATAPRRESTSSCSLSHASLFSKSPFQEDHSTLLSPSISSATTHSTHPNAQMAISRELNCRVTFSILGSSRHQLLVAEPRPVHPFGHRRHLIQRVQTPHVVASDKLIHVSVKVLGAQAQDIKETPGLAEAAHRGGCGGVHCGGRTHSEQPGRRLHTPCSSRHNRSSHPAFHRGRSLRPQVSLRSGQRGRYRERRDCDSPSSLCGVGGANGRPMGAA